MKSGPFGDLRPPWNWLVFALIVLLIAAFLLRRMR